MTHTPPPVDNEAAEESLEQALREAAANNDPCSRPENAVTDCGVTPGHNRLEDRDGA